MSNLGVNIYPADKLYLRQVADLQDEAFGEAFHADLPILGETNDDIVADNLHDLLVSPTTKIVGLLRGRSELVGFSLSMPMSMFDPTNYSDDTTTAYEYWGMITGELRNGGLIKTLQDATIRRLRGEGFTSLIGDTMIEGGLAANSILAYGDAVTLIELHRRWEEVGYQARIAVDIDRLLQQDQVQATS